MVAFTGNDPRNAVLKDAETVSGVGIVLTKDSTNNKLKVGVAASVPIGISAGESSRDADLEFETTGATVSYFPMGGVQMVASAASITYNTGDLVYLKASGRISNVAGSDKLVGVYVGEGETTSSTAGDLVPVNTSQCATA